MNPMKKIIFIALLLLSFSSIAVCDYKDEIQTLTARMQELAGSKTGLSDSERFEEIVAMTYEYTMLSFPEFATYLGDPRGQDRWSDQSEAITLQRQQAIDYFMQNAGKQEHDVTVEVDRYIVWPGQALAYKIGELKIKELRAYATDELGEEFDIREFHDEVLGRGSVPLSVLDANIRAWVGTKKAE